MLNRCHSTYRNRKKVLQSNGYLIVIIFFLLTCLFLNTQLTNKQKQPQQISADESLQLFLTHVRDILITEQNDQINIVYNITTNNIIPSWLNEYRIAHFFNYYWLQNGAYHWHLQRLLEFEDTSASLRTNFKQRFPESFNQTNIHSYLHNHPEYGIILDSASDPVPPFFLPLPQTSVGFKQTCERDQKWCPCQRQSNRISPLPREPLITYVLYDVTLDVCPSCQLSSTSKTIHYEEFVYLFDSVQQTTNETYFVRQILPRLVRLLALVPKTAFILIPHLDSKSYVKQYLEILVHCRLVKDRKRFLSYNSSQIYHANALYSTSSPRSDLLLLQQILKVYHPPVRQELILVIQKQLSEYSYNEIIETLNQFELPYNLQYITIEEYDEHSYNLTQISHLFRQARIVIGMPTDILSHIVWCLPRTHIIEIVRDTMTLDYYEMSLQLRLIYWLAKTTETNQIDRIDLQNLFMKVLADVDA